MKSKSGLGATSADTNWRRPEMNGRAAKLTRRLVGTDIGIKLGENRTWLKEVRRIWNAATAKERCVLRRQWGKQ